MAALSIALSELAGTAVAVPRTAPAKYRSSAPLALLLAPQKIALLDAAGLGRAARAAQQTTPAVEAPAPEAAHRHPLRLQYHLRIARPTTHLLEVEIDAEDVTSAALDFVMPAWAPGRYAIYGFAKNVQEFRATGARGQALRWMQPDKQTWRVEATDSGGVVRVYYRVFADDLTGSFSQVDSTHANLNGAAVYMYVAGHKPDAIWLAVEAPRDWKIISAFSLSTDQHNFEAPNYDRLIDTPMEISPECAIEQFTEQGKTFRVVIHSYGGGDSGPADQNADSAAISGMSSLVEKLKEVVHSEMAMMPPPDFEHYTFFFHFVPDVAMGDGMEHLNSTQIIIRGGLDASAETEAIETAAHEFFHLWNVKRLRPAPLGPFDYTKEDYTDSLWFAEGITQYYSYVHLLRSGLWTREQFLERLSSEIRNLELEPGRSLMSAESSSFHAWFYDRAPQMQETNFANSTISYYNKGALLGTLMDLEIRGRTGGRKSLDDVLRLMYDDFYGAPAGPTGSDPASSYYLPGRAYEEDDILHALDSVSGSNFTPFFDRYVRGTDPLPYVQALAHAGLRLRVSSPEGSPPGIDASTRQEEHGLRILSVVPGGAAERAGLSTNDLLVDVDQFSLATGDLNSQLKIYPPGTEVPFSIERHGRRMRITLKLSPPVADQYAIEELPEAPLEEIHVREGWLGR